MSVRRALSSGREVTGREAVTEGAVRGGSVPKLIYGTAWKRERTTELVATAIQRGFRAVDSAGQPRHYDEVAVGRGITKALMGGLGRTELYLQSKFTPIWHQDPDRLPYDPDAPVAQQVAQSIRRSLMNLDTDYLDCLLLHAPMKSASDAVQVWRAMEACHDAGLVRALGISNCYWERYLAAVWTFARIKPKVVQNRFSRELHFDDNIRKFCHSHGASYQAFSTLTGNQELLATDVVGTLAARYGRTREQVVLRYLVERSVVPVVGPKDEKHMREDLQVLEFQLADDERENIDALLKQKQIQANSKATQPPS